jgi:hypothetical protein
MKNSAARELITAVNIPLQRCSLPAAYHHYRANSDLPSLLREIETFELLRRVANYSDLTLEA